MEDFNYEELLNAWLHAETSIKSPKQVTSLTYNESVICNLLLQDAKNDGFGLTASQLCRATQIHKSQMNRILNTMEAKELIVRTRSEEDKRKVYVTFNSQQNETFKKQHTRVIGLVMGIVEDLGPERSRELTQALNDLADAARRVIG